MKKMLVDKHRMLVLSGDRIRLLKKPKWASKDLTGKVFGVYLTAFKGDLSFPLEGEEFEIVKPQEKK